MHKFINKLPAFSLAETLITLLIVTVLAMVSVPMLTKKKSDAKAANVHGKWVCVLQGSQHVAKTTVNGSTTSVSNASQCIFTPPVNSKDYVVKVIGGGGGGAAGSQPIVQIFNGNTTYTIPESGQYIVAVVGGGGTGGTVWDGICKTYEETKTGGGGSGGYVLQTIPLRKDARCSISVGSRGAVNERAPGSSFSCSGYNFTAEGGQSGRSKTKWHHDGGASHSDYDYCDWTRDNGVNNGGGGSPSGSAGSLCSKYSPCGGRISNSRLNKYTTGISSSGNYGNGGDPSLRGNNGVVSMTRTDVGSGGAGGAGATVVRGFPKLSITTVRLGRGGDAGTSNRASGTMGGTTTFGTILTAVGGSGGEPNVSTVTESTAKGQNAMTPEITTASSAARSYGGFTQNNSGSENATKADYNLSTGAGSGSGGSGGGASMDVWGRGAVGNPGSVIIEW